MKGTSKPRLPHLRPAHPHLRVRGWFLSENAAMPPGQQVKVHKSASFVDILEVCKFTTFCDRKGYTNFLAKGGGALYRTAASQSAYGMGHSLKNQS